MAPALRKVFISYQLCFEIVLKTYIVVWFLNRSMIKCQNLAGYSQWEGKNKISSFRFQFLLNYYKILHYNAFDFIKLCKWWWLLSLLIFSCERLWSYCSSWYLCSWMSTICWSPPVWHTSAPEESSKTKTNCHVVQKIKLHCCIYLM